MGFSCTSSESNMLSKNTKVVALESTLQQCVLSFRELVVDLEQLQIESDHYQSQYIELKEKCESKNCTGVEYLKKEIIKKNEIIQSVASILTKLHRTKDITILSEALEVLNQDQSPLTPPDDKTNIKKVTPTKDLTTENLKKSPKCSRTPKKVNTPTKTKLLNNGIKKLHTPYKYGSPKKSGTPKKIGSPKNLSPKRDVSITEDVSFNEESLCEIDGTPTGRTSPIIPSKRTRSTFAKSTDSSNKKKLPDGWSSSPSKSIKLTFTTPTGSRGRLIQSRINVVKVKPTTVVDLTCSPEVNLKNEFVQALVKKESIENDDTILPSPTSNNSLFKPMSNKTVNSPVKFKKPALSLVKTEKVEKQDENQDIKQMEESISIMNRIPDRLKVKTETPTYTEPVEMDEDATHCETQISVSLLNHVNKLEKQHQNLLHNGPSKSPLAENINIVNTPPRADGDSSVSLRTNNNPLHNVPRKLPELVEPLYREPAPRKKAEKRALQGWSCDECQNFYGTLYKDDPVMLARKIEECSKHRGKHNPARPKTPEGFWDPRWSVPENTEELNRINNAV